MINFLKNLFKFDSRSAEQKEIETWLSNSSDLADLERRQKQLQRGTAPMQLHTNLRGWM